MPYHGVINVAIIEDKREIRAGLTMLINGTDGYRCSGSFHSMEEALDRIGADVPSRSSRLGANRIGSVSISG